MASWEGQTNPRTGRPFQSQAEYDDYEKWYQGQQAGASAAASASDKASKNAGPGYSWGDTTNYWQDPTTGNYYFGQKNSAAPSDATGNLKDSLGPSDAYKAEYDTQGIAGTGYIDPHTGQYYYTATAGQYNPGATGANKSGYTGGAYNSRQYDYKTDYGLGPGNEGIIPLAHDAAGTPTAFYAGTAGGGGQVFTSLSDAQTAVKSYATWYPSQHPNEQQPTTPQTPTQNQPTGELLNPGAGENYFDSTKNFYGKPSEAGQLWSQTRNQPTASQQQWNAYSGIFGNPAALDDVYERGRQAAETTLARRSASAGWGDSGAAARATGNLGIAFTDAATKAKENWALTGGQLAAAADTSNNQRFGQALNVDQGDLARIQAGQSAANSAENLQQNRLTGGLSSAMQLGQLESGLIYSGLTSAQQQDLQLQLAGLQLKQQQGQLTADQAYAEAQNYLQALGVAGNAAVNYYVQQKLGKKAA